MCSTLGVPKVPKLSLSTSHAVILLIVTRYRPWVPIIQILCYGTTATQRLVQQPTSLLLPPYTSRFQSRPYSLEWYLYNGYSEAGYPSIQHSKVARGNGSSQEKAFCPIEIQSSKRNKGRILKIKELASRVRVCRQMRGRALLYSVQTHPFSNSN